MADLSNCFVQPQSATAAMTEDTPLPFDLPAVHREKITVDFNGGNQSSNAGLLLLRGAERSVVCARGLRQRYRITAGPRAVLRMGRPLIARRFSEKEADHLAAGIWPSRVGIGSRRAATGPCVTKAMNHPLL